MAYCLPPAITLCHRLLPHRPRLMHTHSFVYVLCDCSRLLISILCVILAGVNVAMIAVSISSLQRVCFLPLCAPTSIPRTFWKLGRACPK